MKHKIIIGQHLSPEDTKFIQNLMFAKQPRKAISIIDKAIKDHIITQVYYNKVNERQKVLRVVNGDNPVETDIMRKIIESIAENL